LDDVAFATGISYDTLLRIRDGKTDPAFGKVQQLRDYFLSAGAAKRRKS
jgi:predicted transcriptional regulator